MTNDIPDIILVEDNAADREIALFALQENNLANRVKVLKDGEEAINYIFRQGEYSDCGISEHPALILLDLNLPKISGLEILRRIKSDARTRGIPVVVFTSSPEEQDRIESYNLGVNSYITKPFKYDDFAGAIARIGSYWARLNEHS